MDYISILTYTKHGNDYAFLVIHTFYKMSILVAYKKNFVAKATAKIFFKRVWVHFGIP